jgi:hypothetical protein
MLADCFEALMGAIYIDLGLEACRNYFACNLNYFVAIFSSNLLRFCIWTRPKRRTTVKIMVTISEASIAGKDANLTPIF